MGGSGTKPIIGILGGIASGKSTVASELAKLGCKVIDADRIAHKLFCRKDVREEIVRLFGQSVLDCSGQIDRKKLADIAFAAADKLSSLNRVIHPLVLQEVERLVEKYGRQSQVKAIVLDMPLLAEVGWAKRCDSVIFVACDRSRRVDRAKKMGLDDRQIKIRENFQISLDNKASIADNVIDNNSDFTALVRQVTDIFSCVVNSR